MIKVNTDNYEFLYPDIDYEINKISPEIEMVRHIEFNRIVVFIQDICKGYKLIPNKKSLEENIYSLLSRLIFSFFSEKHDKYTDSFFPFNDKYEELFSTMFKYTFKNNVNIEKALKKINLPLEFKKAIDQIKNYKITNIKFYTVEKHPKYIMYKSKLQNFKLEFKLPINVYTKLKNNFLEYKKNNNHFYELDYLIYCLLIRYNTLHSLGHQWGIPTNIKDELRDKFKINFECFASSFNHYYKYYCSMFYDIEKYFMSIGYFQNVTYIKGFYIANPPYDNDLLAEMVNTFLYSLDKTDKKLSFMFGLPNWNKYLDYKLPEITKNSKYFLYQKTFKDGEIKWYDFMTNEYKRIPSSIRSVITNNKNIKHKDISNTIDKWIKL